MYVLAFRAKIIIFFERGNPFWPPQKNFKKSKKEYFCTWPPIFSLQSLRTKRSKMFGKNQSSKEWKLTKLLKFERIIQFFQKLALETKIWITRPILKQLGQFLFWIVRHACLLLCNVFKNRFRHSGKNYCVRALCAPPHAGAYPRGPCQKGLKVNKVTQRSSSI
jgi:hypothetical protein